MSDLSDKIDRHVRQMAPHVAERETAKLLIEASKEIKSIEFKLRSIRNKNSGRGYIPYAL